MLLLAGICRAQDDTNSAVIQPPVSASSPEAQPAAADATSPGASKPFYKRLFTGEALSASLPGAAIGQWHDWPAEWGPTGAGFAKRTASLFGQFVIGNAIEDGVRAIHPQNTRYVRSGEGSFFKRVEHVVTGTVLAGKPDGGRELSYSRLANAYGSWAIATLWSPPEFRTPGSIFEWGTAGVGAMAVTNLAREFWPDLKRRFHKK